MIKAVSNCQVGEGEKRREGLVKIGAQVEMGKGGRWGGKTLVEERRTRVPKVDVGKRGRKRRERMVILNSER